MQGVILLIEDDATVANLVARNFASGDTPLAVREAPTIRDGLRLCERDQIDCVVLDYRLPDGDGLGALRTFRRRWPALPVVMLTGAGSEEIAVEAMKLGAYDYVVKHGTFLATLRNVVGTALVHQLLLDNRTARQVSDDIDEVRLLRFKPLGFWGKSLQLDRLLQAIDRAAATDASVLLQGESGTGKELVARAIHALSARQRRPLVTVNCAAIPELLLESELFGHVRGAFSGAGWERRGLFEEADEGSLFLDEVGELPFTVQAKLLRVLQEGEIRPVGANRARQVDVRIVAATNSDLGSAVSEGRFRLDLFHRLHVLPIRVPPLRERQGDVRILAHQFCQVLAERERRLPIRLRDDTLAALERYPWPGNVRELHNLIHVLVLNAGSGQEVGPEALPPTMWRPSQGLDRDRPLKDIVRDVEVSLINERLRAYGYRRSATAESLGLTREGLWQKLRALGVQLPRR